MSQTCKIQTCAGGLTGFGLCSKHYQRLRRYGDPNFVRQVKGESRGTALETEVRH